MKLGINQTILRIVPEYSSVFASIANVDFRISELIVELLIQFGRGLVWA